METLNGTGKALPNMYISGPRYSISDMQTMPMDPLFQHYAPGRVTTVLFSFILTYVHCVHIVILPS